MKRVMLIVTGLLFIATILSAGGSRESADRVVVPNQVSIGTSGLTGRHLIPIWGTSTPQFVTYPLILPALTWYNDEMDPAPLLAESIDVNADATSYTFTLPGNAAWSDGTPLTAHDVYFTYKLAVNDALSDTAWRNTFRNIQGIAEYIAGTSDEISGLVVVNDRTITMNLVSPDSSFLHNTNLGILPRHILQDVAPEDLGAHPYANAPTVTSGPYDFVEYREGQFIHLRRKEDYWGQEAQIENVFIVMLESEATRLAQLAAGELDISPIPPDEVARFERSDAIDVETGDGIGFLVTHVDARSQEWIDRQNAPQAEGGGGGNLDGSTIQKDIKPYLQEVAFRQALAYAIDIDAMINVVADGFARPIYSPIFGPSWAINPDLNPYQRNVETARSLMESIGIEFDGSGNALWEGERIILTLLSSISERDRRIAEFLQQQFGDIGIRLDLRAVTSAAFLTSAIGGDGDLVVNAGGRFGADPSLAAAFYTTSAGWARLVMGYANPEFDELMDRGRASGDPVVRAEYYHEASAILNTELPSLFFMSPSTIIGRNHRLMGVRPTADVGYLTWNITDWHFSE